MPPKPLPTAILKPNSAKKDNTVTTKGIILGDNITWNPVTLPNGHVVLIGASGSGKTQTLKAIAHELPQVFPEVRIIIVDFHGDLELPGETYYPLDMESSYGINPLVVDLDTKGGGPNLQAISVAATFKKALVLGANQEGLVISILNSCYRIKGIVQDDFNTWTRTPPTFADVRSEIEARVEDGCKESVKLQLKLAATFQYGIFDKPQPSLNHPIIRFDLSALGKVPGLSAIASEALTKQLMDSHRIMGEIEDKTPRSFVFIDEAKEVKNSRSIKIILGDGRKYGLCAVLASQRDAEISDEAIANSSTKIVLMVDQSEVKRVARRFRFAENIVAALQPLEALVRMGTIGTKCKIKPYYERV
ncbi:ATP-binding protein [Rivularia sp. UHCC 0363]|uniref:ATP-binding protein n=1 Tax=Rivularia sp. UHCC 0363 TaxID=3110244 RepID=UPI002B1F8CA3|nr:type IV secretion system DNA-binding domain-containing protein [Rivularia sp. UHCC 0363]MEA5595707.1 type IV secretion system DNA-binding domain-containing protein [Rivularia sp. UHCC 0363]